MPELLVKEALLNVSPWPIVKSIYYCNLLPQQENLGPVL